MAQQQVRFDQYFAAPVDRVFAWFADHERFGRIWPGTFRCVKESADGRWPHGLGSVREIRSGGMTFEETITAFEPPKFIEYRVTKGGPIKNHVGRLRFAAADGGTRLDYSIEFDPRVPLTGGLIASVLCAAWHRGVDRAVEALTAGP